MKDICSCMMTGTLARDAEQDQNGVRFSLKCTETQWNGQESKETDSYFNCRMARKTSDTLMQYLTEGRKLTVLCRPRQITWNDRTTGARMSSVVFMVNDLILGSAPYREDGNGGGSRKQQTQQKPAPQPQGPENFQDDNIPF